MRILQIIDHVGVDAGISSVVMNLYRNMDYTKIQFDFLVCSKREESYENEIVSRGGKLFFVGNPLSVREIGSACYNVNLFFKEHAEEYKIVQLHSPTMALFTLRYAKKYGVEKRIVHSHSTMTSTNKLKCVANRFLMEQVFRYGNEFWACSTEAAVFLYGEKFCSEKRFEIIWNAVDTKKFTFVEEIRNRVRNEYHLNDYCVVAHVSNFSPIKNVSFLIPVMKNVIRKRKDIRFLFIGEGPTWAGFKQEVECFELSEYCVFMGRVHNVQDYLQGADLLLLPSLKEGLPISVIEAQASGLECLLSDTITKEVDVGSVKYLPLKESVWEQEIGNREVISQKQRQERSELFRKSRFNIINEAARVEKLYLTLESR